ncbi:hypothetical protein BDV38DRAFT_252542 [Aspergillus pseudotamarii]|uniref:Uncharacterized protein n=1 Tax=Aspergillus pseudotamarii TaxID=132259 RepID=A0A5N6SL95_ASPPS|nr:uncharacterized protein BDV38DRAFT_252542 [Aspergillus pseudotamarii]KAE8135315.1 hypothetical protein BDV38DRAFT_252542 [Aspergillus pseudotamarii]
MIDVCSGRDSHLWGTKFKGTSYQGSPIRFNHVHPTFPVHEPLLVMFDGVGAGLPPVYHFFKKNGPKPRGSALNFEPAMYQARSLRGNLGYQLPSASAEYSFHKLLKQRNHSTLEVQLHTRNMYEAFNHRTQFKQCFELDPYSFTVDALVWVC